MILFIIRLNEYEWRREENFCKSFPPNPFSKNFKNRAEEILVLCFSDVFGNLCVTPSSHDVLEDEGRLMIKRERRKSFKREKNSRTRESAASILSSVRI